MATKTLILRPCGISIDDTSLVTLYPSNTLPANAYKLVNEEVADDDATYILGAKNSTIHYYFQYNVPDDLNMITNFHLCGRFKAETISSSAVGNYIENTLHLSVDYPISNFTLGKDSGYMNFSKSINTDVNVALTELNEINSARQLHISQTISNESKNNPIRTTQLYIEITYESKEPICLKSNGTWTLVQGAIYKKTNGVWTKITSETLQNNTKYLINNIT